MQYTESVVDCLKGIAQDHPEPIDWQRACEQVKDPRRKQGQRFSLTSILLLALAAMLSNHLSELAIAEWGAGQSEEIKKALGFEKGVTPHQTTIQRLFRRVSAEEIETVFRRLFLHLVNPDQQERGACAVSIDGKAQRGRLKFEEEKSYAVHAVSLLDHQTGIVLTQGHVEKTDVEPKEEPADVETTSKLAEEKEPEEQEDKKQKSELAVASRLIQHIDWNGKVLTGDALYCQRCLCAALRQAGGDYLFLVKGNQPQLLEDVRVLFAPLAAPKRAGEGVLRLPEQHAHTTEKAHGRLDMRSIRVSSELKGYSDWPGLEQVFEIRRCWHSKGIWKEAVRYGVTSLPAPIAIPERLLQLKRGHWQIENGLHYIKDVTMGEDKSTVHADNGPKIMATLRNTVVSLLRHAGFSTIATRMRYNSTHPVDIYTLLWYYVSMRLSQYAKQLNVTYKTAYRWWKAGKLDAYQLESGTVIVRDPVEAAPSKGVALYARVSSSGQKEDLDRQVQRLRDYAASRGYQVVREVSEIASGLNDQRPKLEKLLADTRIGTIVVENRDRLTPFGSHYIETLLETQGRHLEMIFPTDTGDELVDDFVSVITSMAARIYGRRQSKRRAEKIKQCVEQVMKEEEE